MSSRNSSRDAGGNDHRNGEDEPLLPRTVLAAAAAAARHDERMRDLRQQLRSLLNEEDDADLAMDWLLGGKIDAKHFAKALPHTAQDLRDGKTSPQALIRCMRLPLSATINVRAKDGNGFVGTLMEIVINYLAAMTIPKNWCRNDEQELWLKKAHVDFTRDVYRHLDCPFTNDNLVDFAANVLVEFTGRAIPSSDPRNGQHCGKALFDSAQGIQLALKETCEEWEQKVDNALFKGKKSATFLFLCPTYKKSLQETAKMVCDIYLWQCDNTDDQYKKDLQKIYAKKMQLDAAVQLVADSALKSSCWECGKAATTLSHCSKCKVAEYCSRECQRVAWQSGHKSKCGILMKKSDAFYESWEVVEHVHRENGGTMEGTKLSCMDYSFLANNVIRHSFPLTIELPDASQNQEGETPLLVPEGPSMEFFYKNFRRVLRGDWWFYSNTDSLEDYYAKVSGTGLSDFLPRSVDQNSFDYLFHCLCYDIFGFIAEMASDRIQDEDEMMALLFGDKFLVPAATAADNGVAMPAERFIELYQFSDTPSVVDLQLMGDAKAKSRSKSNAKASALQFLRKNYHK